MSIENAAISTTHAAPAHVPVDTSDMEDYGSRIHAVMENAQAESRATQREEATEELASDEAAAASTDEDSTPDEESEKPKVKAEAKVETKAPPAGPSPEELARKASLANAARLERESVKRSNDLATKAAELKAQEARLAEQAKTLSRLEKAYTDPDELLSLLAEKVTPEKMSQFFIEQGQPEKVAERRAKAAQEPVTSEIAKVREELAALKAETARRESEAKARADRQESEKQFSERVLDMKADVPHAARLLSKRPKEFFAMADAAAISEMAAAKAEGRQATWEQVIRGVNKELADFARDLQDEVAATAPSTTEKTGSKSAAAKAPTVSNRAASDRSTILSEDEAWDSLPFDERVARAVKRARAT